MKTRSLLLGALVLFSAFVVCYNSPEKTTNPNCAFCTVVVNDVKHQVIKEGKNVVAIKKLRPTSHVNFLIIPKEHITNFITAQGRDDIGDLFQEMFEMIHNLRDQRTSGAGHFSLHINNGRESAQSIFHLHMHVTSPDASWGF